MKIYRCWLELVIYCPLGSPLGPSLCRAVCQLCECFKLFAHSSNTSSSTGSSSIGSSSISSSSTSSSTSSNTSSSSSSSGNCCSKCWVETTTAAAAMVVVVVVVVANQKNVLASVVEVVITTLMRLSRNSSNRNTYHVLQSQVIIVFRMDVVPLFQKTHKAQVVLHFQTKSTRKGNLWRAASAIWFC